MTQCALMVWGPSADGEFGSYVSAEENAAQQAATGIFTDQLLGLAAQASRACRRRVEVRPVVGG